MIADEIPHDPDSSPGQEIGDIIENQQVGVADGEQTARKQKLFPAVLWIKTQQEEAGGYGKKAVLIRGRQQHQSQDEQCGGTNDCFFEMLYGTVHALHQFSQDAHVDGTQKQVQRQVISCDIWLKCHCPALHFKYCRCFSRTASR